MTLTEFIFASFAFLAIANLVAIFMTRIRPRPIECRRIKGRRTLQPDAFTTSPLWLEPIPRPSHVRTPFRGRLARYLGCDESRLGNSTASSKMIFWVLETCYSGKPAKSREYIRFLLNRIRRHLRKD
jgi:hypothetical protein